MVVESELLSVEEALKFYSGGVVGALINIGVKIGDNLEVEDSLRRKLNGVFYGFRKSGVGLWISIGRDIMPCSAINEIRKP